MQHNRTLHEDIPTVPVLPPDAEKHAEKPHVCTECGKQFATKGNLKRHMLIHTGNRPHACTVCDYKTTYKHSLTDHIRTHTGENLSPVMCVGNLLPKMVILNDIKLHTQV